MTGDELPRQIADALHALDCGCADYTGYDDEDESYRSSADVAAVVARRFADAQVAAEREERRREREVVLDDLRRILEALGLGDHARPYSANQVVQREVLPAIYKLRGQP